RRQRGVEGRCIPQGKPGPRARADLRDPRGDRDLVHARGSARIFPEGNRPAMAALLEIKHVSKFFGGLAANSDVSFDVRQDEIGGLIGPNGAGKTTLCNCIVGYYPPSKGEVLFDRRRMNGLQPDAVCKLGMARTWQKVRPLTNLTVLDNVVVGALW